MKLFGTLQKGQIQLDEPPNLPDGTRILSMIADEFVGDADFGDLSELEYPHPMAPYDAEQEAALIRERVLAVRAGGKTIPLDEAIAGLEESIHRASKRV